ncbi:arrestin domain-containing protein 4-like [Pecten maximus]|uniref:arrestin domain-containing protein 4-like n=1 Tax=Pecten maximus TaxID=6579 RepID=UPI0014584F19|nr:arrestin domain-containing protein 4-like [Pecten maximus]XP_033732302.1 arrestin domain-containing protein 4-like [Pecten maximus]
MGSSVLDFGLSLEHDIDEQYQYTPGEIVKGTINIETNGRTSIRKISINIRGEGVVAWEDQVNGSFKANEEYINATHIVEESRNPEPIILEKGTHQFEFEYRLPDNLPSSFIGKFGSVTYVFKACANGDRPGETSIISEPFLILRNWPLPEQFRQGASAKIEKRIWRKLTCGKVKLSANINRLGGTQGEDLYINAEVANRSPARIIAMQTSLIMNTLYLAQNRAIPFRQIVNKRRDEYELLRGDGRRWQNVRLSIPPYIPETRLEFCDIIEVSYTLQFRIEIAGGKELKIEFPFMVGSMQDGHETTSRNKNEIMNRQWTLSSKELQMGPQSDHPEPDYDQDRDWYHQNVPELRPEDSKVMNPLFQDQEKKITHKNIENFQPTLDELPEVIENTKL